MIELTTAQCEEILEAAQVAHVGVVDAGEPYVTPMSFVMVDGDLATRTGPGRRIDAMRTAPRVCVEVSRTRDDGGWESVVFWGAARFVEDPNIQADVVARLLAKYHSESAFSLSSNSVGPSQRHVIVVTPDKITGRASGSGFSATLKPGRL